MAKRCLDLTGVPLEQASEQGKESLEAMICYPASIDSTRIVEGHRHAGASTRIPDFHPALICGTCIVEGHRHAEILDCHPASIGGTRIDEGYRHPYFIFKIK